MLTGISHQHVLSYNPEMKTFWRIDSLMECEYDKIRINYENVPFHGGKMKKVIFDVDGVLLSEERYFDIAALTVWEILYSPKYMGMPAEKDNFIVGTVNEGRIAECRKSVWGNGTLISWLKARGINSNWDIVHAALITIFWIMAEVYSARSGGEKVAFRLESEKDVQETGKILMGIPVPSADKILEKWEKTVPEGIYGEDVIHTLAAAMAPSFANPDTWAELRSFFWKIHTSAFQEWYLGDDNYIRYLHKAPYSGGKPGFLDRETPLALPSGIKNMFERLKESGYELGVATGRARIEMEVPFKTYGWDEEFESNYLATASDAVDESKMYGGSVPDKPHPFIYLCAAYGRNKENYPAYMAGTIARGSEDEIYVCGDSFSDLLGSRAAGFRFIGVLYGAEKDKTASLFEKEGVPYVHNVLEIPDLLSGI